MSRYDVFISYSRADQAFVHNLVKRLAESGLNVFFDEASLSASESFAAALHQAVLDARYVLVVMSPDYFASHWATREMELGLKAELESGNTKVIPLLVRDCEIPPLLATKLYADFRVHRDFEDTFIKLLSAVKGLPLSRKRRGTEEKQPATRLGSIASVGADSPELRQMVEDLRARVDAFLDRSEVDTEQGCVPTFNVDPTLCFVVMPFGPEELSDVYEYFVKPSIETTCNMRCERGDDVFGSNVIMDDIRKSLERARLVIADLTGRNANVFYEVGIAHALKKDVLLLAQSMSDVPFDLRHRRVLVYDYTPKGCKKLERTIAENVTAILEKGA